MDVLQDLVSTSGWPSLPVWPILKVKRAPKRTYPSFRRFSCAIANHFFGWSRFWCQKCQIILWTSVKNFFYAPGCPSRPVWPILKVKRALKRTYPSFRWFLCAIANHFWVIRILTSKMPIFLWTSVKTLSMHPVGPHGPSNPFWRSNDPRSEHTAHFDNFCVL